MRIIKVNFFIVVYVKLVSTHAVTSHTQVPKTAAVGSGVTRLQWAFHSVTHWIWDLHTNAGLNWGSPF